MKYWLKLVKFNKELIYDRKYLNTKIKNYNEKCITNFFIVMEYNLKKILNVYLFSNCTD